MLQDYINCFIDVYWWVKVCNIIWNFYFICFSFPCLNLRNKWCWVFTLCCCCWVLAQRFDIPWDGVHIVERLACMGMFFSGLCTFIVSNKRGGMGSEGYGSKKVLFINLFVWFLFMSQLSLFLLLLFCRVIFLIKVIANGCVSGELSN